jgi:hypothetical protein
VTASPWGSRSPFGFADHLDLEGAGANSNVVLHDVAVGIRYEDDLKQFRVWNTTFGSGVARAFVDATSTRVTLDVRNVAFLGSHVPSEAAGASNLAVGANAFTNAAGHDYRPTATSLMVDAGVPIGEVGTDREGISRPQGRAYDVGAYELR